MESGKRYIQVCGSALEVRALWVPAPGDFYYDGPTKQVSVVVVGKLKLGRQSRVWLPRADQLLIIAEKCFTAHYLQAYTVNAFHQYLINRTPNYCTSYEMMLLQFVMYVRFKKRLTATNWQALPRGELKNA
jgi:hypothetical protein